MRGFPVSGFNIYYDRGGREEQASKPKELKIDLVRNPEFCIMTKLEPNTHLRIQPRRLQSHKPLGSSAPSTPVYFLPHESTAQTHMSHRQPGRCTSCIRGRFG